MKIKKIDYFALHSLILNPILNGMAFFYTDVFYENQTHIGNSLHHPIYYFFWSLSTVFGFYYYSKMIWDHFNLNYSIRVHRILCLFLFLSIFIPYYPDGSAILNDIHVWIAIGCTGSFFGEWIYLGTMTILSTYKETYGYFMVMAFGIFLLFFFGHVTSICEIAFSCLSSIYLWCWWKKLAR
ncbi:MAG: hypothetical protein HUJ53_09510 [Holdemanella sp.]|nr:hypothetical protein [Holdemanella sp.]